MQRRPHAVAAVLVALLIRGSFAAEARAADTYPTRPIRIVTAAAAGGIDFAARILAQGLTSALGQQVIVDNRGGSAVIAAEVVAGAPADGHTLLYYGSAVWLAPFMGGKVPYDPLKSFAPITLATSAPNVLVITQSVPVTSVKDLVAYGRAKPGVLSFASAGAGGSSHLAGELFKAMAGLDMLRISFRGTAPALNSVAAGEVSLMFSATTAAKPYMQSGKLKAIAVTTAQPSALLPGLPTVAASGLPGYEAASIHGLFAPAGTPPVVVARINREAVKTLAQPDVKEKFAAVGIEPVGSTPGELAATLKGEMAKYGKVIRGAGEK
jgi:tripartite-type tricarboxylate transporter receptor subunit TctC